MKTKFGFTLIEILIAAAIFSGFMVGVFAIFHSGSSSFIAGNWKTQSQNKLRIMLEDIKSDIEKANNVYAISQSVHNQIATTPIYIKASAYVNGVASFPVLNISSANTFVPIMFLSITTPRINASIFAPTAVSGKWSGSSLWAKKGKLYFTRTGNPARYTTYPQALPGAVVSYSPPGVAVGASFEPSSRDTSIIIDDVESIGFIRNKIASMTSQTKDVLKVRVVLRRTRGGNPTNTTLEEIVEAKMQELTDVTAF